MRHVALLMASTLFVPLQRASAQQPGQRVRLTTDWASPQWLVGTLVSQDADSFQLRVAGYATPVSVARRAVARLEISRGQKRAAGKGVVIGLGLGLIAGVGIAAKNSPSCGTGGLSEVCSLNNTERVVADAFIGGLAGGMVGALLGYAVRTERWDAVSLGRAHVAVAPRGAGLAVSVAF